MIVPLTLSLSKGRRESLAGGDSPVVPAKAGTSPRHKKSLPPLTGEG